MKNIIIIFFCMSMLMFQATAQNHADVKRNRSIRYCTRFK